MSEIGERRWAADDEIERLPSRSTFSLGALFRAVTLLCLALGWPALVRSAPPVAVLTALVAIVGVMAAIAGIRRCAPLPSRIL